MATSLVSIDTQHDDMIHDSQFDYYAKRLATCSSDRTVKIFDVAGERFHNSATLTGHEGLSLKYKYKVTYLSTYLYTCTYVYI
jgi:protein transport protein SEC13